MNKLLAEFYVAVRIMLVTRIKYGQDSPEFLTAINQVITLHDALALHFIAEEIKSVGDAFRDLVRQVMEGAPDPTTTTDTTDTT